MARYTGESNELIPQYGIAMFLLEGQPFRFEEREYHEINMEDIRRVVVALTRPENFGGAYRARAQQTRSPTEPEWRYAFLRLKDSLHTRKPHLGIPALHLHRRGEEFEGSIFSEEPEAVDYVRLQMRAEPEWKHLADKPAHSFTVKRLLSTLGFTVDQIDTWIDENWKTLETAPPPEPTLPPDRQRVEINKIRRDRAMVTELKQLYEWKCQLCKETIELPGGNMYAEAHHIHPLGEPHNSTQDSKSNLLVVCPNCHVKLDYGAIELNLDDLLLRPPHEIDAACIHYHNERIFHRVRVTD